MERHGSIVYGTEEELNKLKLNRKTMDKEKAIELLDNLIGMIEDNQENDYDEALKMGIKALAIPSAEMIRCKDCKYFEYDSVAKVDGIPLIVAHEICNKWGDGCKTSEDGWCFLAEKGEQPKIIKCPNCGNEQFADKEWCPDCGAIMVEPQERSDGK